MKTFLIAVTLLISSQAQAYVVGDAPFCKVDDFGNAQCFYYTMSQCQFAIQFGGFCAMR